MSSSLKITAMGYWFPVGAPNFFRGEDEFSPDKPLIAHIHSTVAISRQSGEETEARKKKEDLQASVYRRLVTTAPYKDYTQAIPVFPSGRRLSDVRNEPVMVVLTRDLFEQEWPASMKALVMIVHSRGLYLWLAVHDETDSIAVRRALDNHIYDMVGGKFRSRTANPPGRDTDSTASATRMGDDRTLQDYQDKHRGILSFFQINAIFEALNNSAFNPAVFFERPFEQKKDDQFSLGEFIRSITTLTAVGDDDPLPEKVKEKAATDQPQRVFTTDKLANKLLKLTSSSTSIEDKKDIADQLRDDCLTSTVQHDLLRQFIRITSTNVLRVMKSRIERCSRVLLSGMLAIIHRRQPLIQTAAPDYIDNIDGVNDAQLRGYIRYFASKMPLIKNIERSLTEALDREDINRDSEKRDDVNSALYENLETLHAGWTQFVHGIDDDLQGLERAIAQARQDSLLREEERARTEQETIAELQRLHEGSRRRSLEETDPTVSIVSNVIAVIAVILGFLYLFQTSSIQFDSFVWPPNSQTLIATLPVVGLILIGIVISFIVHKFVGLFVRLTKSRQLTVDQRSDHYYYELDMQLNVPIDQDKAQGLLAVDNRPRTRRQKKNERRKVRHHQGPDPLPFNEYRNSYRGERVSHDETIHKVYVATDVRWGERNGRSPLRERLWPTRLHDMRLYLIYEILFHRPSGEHSFLFQSLRVVSPHETVLTMQQLTELKRL
ncbi:MAG TPA: hypothetical protein VH393_13835, partial [Ktedonobacterales bacterium]